MGVRSAEGGPGCAVDELCYALADEVVFLGGYSLLYIFCIVTFITYDLDARTLFALCCLYTCTCRVPQRNVLQRKSIRLRIQSYQFSGSLLFEAFWDWRRGCTQIARVLETRPDTCFKFEFQF